MEENQNTANRGISSLKYSNAPSKGYPVGKTFQTSSSGYYPGDGVPLEHSPNLPYTTKKY